MCGAGPRLRLESLAALLLAKLDTGLAQGLLSDVVGEWLVAGWKP